MKCEATDVGHAREVVKGVLLALETIHPLGVPGGGLERAVCVVHCPTPLEGLTVASLHLMFKERGSRDPWKT